MFLKITQNLLKKLISIILLLSLILPFVGTVSWLNYQKKKVKHHFKQEIIASIEKNELVNFTFTLKEAETKLNWEHSKEFEYNNSMYDIVEADTTNNIITYWCWWDSEETELNKKLKKLLANFLGEDTEDKKTKTQFAQFYQSLYHTKNIPWKAIYKEQNKTKNFAYIVDYTSLHFPPTTPPPNYS